MKMFDRIKEWASMPDGDKVQLDRRAFLQGMAVTSAGLFVPGVTLFDAGRIVQPEANPYWVRSDEPNNLRYTDDVGADFRLIEVSWVKDPLHGHCMVAA